MIDFSTTKRFYAIIALCLLIFTGCEKEQEDILIFEGKFSSSESWQVSSYITGFNGGPSQATGETGGDLVLDAIGCSRVDATYAFKDVDFSFDKDQSLTIEVGIKEFAYTGLLSGENNFNLQFEGFNLNIQPQTPFTNKAFSWSFQDGDVITLKNTMGILFSFEPDGTDNLLSATLESLSDSTCDATARFVIDFINIYRSPRAE